MTSRASTLRSIVALVAKDFTVDMRRRIESGSTLIFAVAAGVLVAYLMGGVAGITPAAMAVSVSLVLLFLAVYGSLAGFVREAEKGTLDGLRLAPIGPEALYVAKLIYSYILLAVNAVAYSFTVALFGGAWEAVSPYALAATLLASLYLASLSSFTSAILVFSEARGVLMPVMILVLSLPYIQLAGPILVGIYSGRTLISNLLLLALGDAGFLIIVLWLSRFILETA
jgi:ABC-type transport system involved in cytochrome c biogenesis permease component